MDELQKYMTEIADLEAFQRWRAGEDAALPLTGTAPRQSHLIDGIRGELLNIAVMTAVTSGLANALERAAVPRLDHRAMLVYAPIHSNFFKTAVEQVIADGCTPEIRDPLQAYAARLALAERMSQAFVTDQVVGEARSHVDQEILADAWRRACEASIVLIEALTAAPRGSLPSELVRAGHVVNMLRMAEGGESPCLERDGRIAIPGWAERRREPRVQQRLVATAILNGKPIPVMLRDVSPAGIGLALPEPAASGQEIVIVLASKRELSGTIAWADGKRAGVRLDERLGEADPLLIGSGEHRQ